jgi:hypothetical protein
MTRQTHLSELLNSWPKAHGTPEHGTLPYGIAYPSPALPEQVAQEPWESLLREAITGVSATAAAGTESPSITIAISGVQATGSVGSEGETITLALSGNGATGAAGNVSLSVSPALTGAEAIGSAGTVIAVVPPIIIIDDTHDGDYKKKKWAEERNKKEKRKQEIIDLYERIVEGKPQVAEEIVAPYVKTKAQGQETAPTVKSNRF